MICPKDLEKTLQFLASVGIQVEQKDLSGEKYQYCAVPGACIHQGKVYYDPDIVSSLGDLLHEAGHFALMIPEWRDLVRFGDLEEVITGNIDRISLDLASGEMQTIENPLYRKVIDGDEQATIAWSYAAAVNIGLNLDSLYLPIAFEVGWTPIQLSLKLSENGYSYYEGVSCLINVWMVKTGNFPKLTRWMQC